MSVDPNHLKKIQEAFGTRLKSAQSATALQTEFQALRLEEQRLWADPKNFITGTRLAQLNRYSDIIPIETTLFPSEAKQDPSLYFNANYLDAPKNPRFANFPVPIVAHQAPIPESFAAFWKAVLKTRALGIVMVTGLVENGRRKADPYWPQKEGETMALPGVGLVIKNCGEVDKEISQAKGLSKILISISKQQEQENQQQQGGGVAAEEFKTVLYRFHEWPDHGVPKDTASYHHLVNQVQERILSFNQQQQTNNTNNTGQKCPLFVHCSAGIGRTGTLIGTLIGDHMFRAGVFEPEKSPFEIVRWLKHSRVGSVQQSEQYMFMHSVLYQQMKSFLASLVSANQNK